MKIKKIIISVILLGICLISIPKETVAMSHYQTVGTTTGIITATALNVRQGPGTNYKVVTVIHKNEYVRVFAQIGDWYVIQTDGDYIGMVSKNYVRLIYPTGGESEITQVPTETDKTNSNGLTADEQETFDLINAQRTAAGLQALQIDLEVQNVARAKAKDMVDNNYFSHTSPNYGSPFDMLKSYGIKYKAAGENIAGNSSNQGAVNAWMNSEGHKTNILSNNYNYTGLGVVNSPKYGKIYVQMFIGK